MMILDKVVDDELKMLKKIDDRTEDQEESLCRVRRGLCFVDLIGTSRDFRNIKLVIIFG